MLGLQNEREWTDFCAAVLRQPALATDPRFDTNSKRSAARTELYAIVAAAFAALSRAEVLARLDATQIAYADVNTMADLWAHPQLQARGRWTTVPSPAGPLPALLPPGVPAQFAPRMDAVPALGEHTDAILAELGYAEADIRQLHQEHVL